MRILFFPCLISFLLFSCKKQKDLAEYKIVTKDDFASFLATKPFELIDSNSYNKGRDDFYFNLFEETGMYTWDGQDWHRDNILPLWKQYKTDYKLLSERDFRKEHFKNFLASEPFPGVDKHSYNNGDDDFFFNLFEEKGQYTWVGQEWHHDHIFPLWLSYKEKHGLESSRTATVEDFARFLATNPVPEIDSSSYNYGHDIWWFLLFQDNNPEKWKGKEWHRDQVLPKWIAYKQKNNLK